MAILTEGDPAGLQTNGPHPAPTTTPGRAIALAIGVVGSLWLTVFPYSAALNNPNERTRVLQARAIVDSGTLAVGTAEPGGGGLVYRDIYGRTGSGPFVNDISVRCSDPADPIPCAGLLYPAKAPGTALLGVPALALARWVGYVDDGPDGEARATWILRLAVMAFTLAGLVALGMLLWRADVRPPIIAGTIVAAGLGSSVFPYGVSFVGHAAAGAALLLGVLALVLAGDGPASRSRTAFAILGGLLTGSAVLFEYHALPAAFAVGVWTLVSPARRRLLPGFIVGGLIAGMAFGWLHNAMFGSPWATGHTTLVSAHNRASQELGFLGIDGLHAGALLALLFDPYLGLGPDMPWLLVAGLGGLPLLARARLGRLPRGMAP